MRKFVNQTGAPMGTADKFSAFAEKDSDSDFELERVGAALFESPELMRDAWAQAIRSVTEHNPLHDDWALDLCFACVDAFSRRPMTAPRRAELRHKVEPLISDLVRVSDELTAFERFLEEERYHEYDDERYWSLSMNELIETLCKRSATFENQFNKGVAFHSSMSDQSIASAKLGFNRVASSLDLPSILSNLSGVLKEIGSAPYEVREKGDFQTRSFAVLIHHELQRLLNQELPQVTTHLTSAVFGTELDIADVRRWIKRAPVKPIT
ncbi:MAG: hypothetical protein KAG72_14315 [Abyssibacter sp.]|nr:hypothetical protein [Abyssibacter sp.]MCK5860520.1 hypothetical protein [Abyssibacter sp.]